MLILLAENRLLERTWPKYVGVVKNSGIRSMYITTNGSLPERIIKTVQELNKEFPSKKIFVSISIDELETRHDEIRKIKVYFQIA